MEKVATPATETQGEVQGPRQAPRTEDMDGEFFSFPYEPYDIQLQLMRQLWQTIDRGHVGIFESPTGTGKSISLICGALSWLTKHTDEYGLPTASAPGEPTASAPSEPAASAGHATAAASMSAKATEPSWLADFDKKKVDQKVEQQQELMKDALVEIEKIRQAPSPTAKKRKIALAYSHHERKRLQRGAGSAGPSGRSGSPATSNASGSTDREEEHLVDAYDSDRAGQAASSDSESEAAPTLVPSRRGGFGEEDPIRRLPVVKIIYCSRTHSQISQFVREINKTAFRARIRVVSLGSRKNLCVNPDVVGLRSDLRMTDRCLDMLQGAKGGKAARKKTAAKKMKATPAKCPFYEKELLQHYKDYALAHVRDIEDLHELGEEMSICAYYGTRESVPLAQVVAMPYSMLLSKDTRESMGIELENNVVVLDEAHNIVEAINSTYRVEVSSKQLVVARRSLWAYFKKYEKRFKGTNAFYIKQLLSILECLTKFLRQLGKDASKAQRVADSGDALKTSGELSGAKMMRINDFLFEARIDHFNLFKILQYLNESGLAKKLMGFVDAEASALPGVADTPASSPADADEEFESRHVSPLRIVESLLKALTSAGGDGRILAQPPNPMERTDAAVKFLLLNSAVHFQEIVEKARSVILAGGTMQPVSQVVSQLFSFLPSDQIDFFSCGHVIPSENLVGLSLSAGPSQQHLEFTYARRHDAEVVDELGRVMLNLSRVVPGGIVVFFPSYRFEDSTVRRWQATGVWSQIQDRKAVFREPRQSDELARVLTEYSAKCVRSPGAGAVLLSVVGGKMSEGINFSDDLARCVVMVGMPYPNVRDPELVEKMAFLDKREPGAGRQFYESLCMKAVNQSIGRAIRHQKDYASIVLVDHRYASPLVRRKLPEWIQRRMRPPSDSFGHAYAELVQFYKRKAAAAVAR